MVLLKKKKPRKMLHRLDSFTKQHTQIFTRMINQKIFIANQEDKLVVENTCLNVFRRMKEEEFLHANMHAHIHKVEHFIY